VRVRRKTEKGKEVEVSENYEVSRAAQWSRIPNPAPILSRFECNVTSHVDKVYTYRPNTYTEFVVVRCTLSSSK